MTDPLQKLADAEAALGLDFYAAIGDSGLFTLEQVKDSYADLVRLQDSHEAEKGEQ